MTEKQIIQRNNDCYVIGNLKTEREAIIAIKGKVAVLTLLITEIKNKTEIVVILKYFSQCDV